MPPVSKRAVKGKMRKRWGSSNSDDPDYELPDDHHVDELPAAPPPPPPLGAAVKKSTVASTTQNSDHGEQNVDINVPNFPMNRSETLSLPPANNILGEDTFLGDVSSSTSQHPYGQVPRTINDHLDVLPQGDGTHGSNNQEDYRSFGPTPMSDSENGGGGSQPICSSLEQILQAITNRHGDISKDCYFESKYVISNMLEGICIGILELEGKKLEQLNISFLLEYDEFLENAERMNFNVKWLRLQVAQLIDAVKSFAEAKEAENEVTELVKKIEDMEKEVLIRKSDVQRLMLMIQGLERELDLKTTQREMLSVKISNLKAKYQSFVGETLTIDSLI